jgi:starch-binding outer membrane protein, SusD/RagB family
MKKITGLNTIIALIFFLSFTSCKKDYGNLNNPTIENFLNNATRDKLNNLVSGTLSGMRNNEGLYLDVTGVVGREIYRFSGADPRYVTDLLGGGSSVLNNTGFYITNPWASRYRVVKNCNVLIQAAANSTLISDTEKKGYTGFAKTIKAYDLLLNLNLTYTNGVRIEVADPENPGPIVGYSESLNAISALLNEAETDLTGATIIYPLTSGFSGFSNAAGFIKFNRALAARVDVYRKQWSTALTDLNKSFFDLNGNFNTGISHVFGTGSGDQLNPAFFPQNQTGEVRLAEPSFATSIEAGDSRIGKALLRNSPTSSSGLTGNRDVWVYTSSTATVPIIRNEELILIYAEANIQLNNFVNAVNAINIIRRGHNLADYSGAVTQTALINEMLKQRRYSLFFEGHRWVDMRRYSKLNELPLSRAGDDVWEAFPLPLTEN